MIRVLIVDDEFLVRVGIKTMINWEELGFEIVGDAENGDQALEMARELRPDLVLTDIRMPKMDGLELIRALKEELPETKVVVLSCYQDFEYVREAMQFLGALDYVPKLSMNPEDIVNVMLNVKQLIETENEKQGQIIRLEKQVNHNGYLKRNNWFRELLLSSDLNKSQWLTQGKNLRLNLKLNPDEDYNVICMRIHKHTKEGKKGSIHREHIHNSIISISDDIIEKNNSHGNTFYIDNEEFCILLNCDLDNDIYEFEKLDHICNQLLDNIKLYVNALISLGIGSLSNGLFAVRDSYQQASQACRFSFYQGVGTIAYSEDILPYNEIWYFDEKMVKKLTSCLDKGEQGGVVAVISEYFDKIINNGRVLPSIVIAECRDIMSLFTSILKMYGSSVYEINNEDPYQILGRFETLNEIMDWYQVFIDDFFKYLKETKQHMYGKEIAKAVQYIKQNYNHEIKLTHVASHIGMNESYLSHLFKKETGLSLTEFINITRIEKAKELLRYEDMNINEVSINIGYANSSYFSKVFKDIVGISPVEYKKAAKNIE
ncbi:MAG: response regulator [Caldicoprobacterales bacterium]|nr:response regulator [Clostridiales bacterium]